MASKHPGGQTQAHYRVIRVGGPSAARAGGAIIRIRVNDEPVASTATSGCVVRSSLEQEEQ